MKKDTMREQLIKLIEEINEGNYTHFDYSDDVRKTSGEEIVEEIEEIINITPDEKNNIIERARSKWEKYNR